MKIRVKLVTIMRTFVLALCLCGVAAAAPGKFYEVTFEELPRQPKLRHLSVTFFVDHLERETVDKIVRESLEHAAAVDPTVDILTSAFNDEDSVLEEEVWSGPLVWDAKAQKVMTLKEHSEAAKK